MAQILQRGSFIPIHLRCPLSAVRVKAVSLIIANKRVMLFHHTKFPCRRCSIVLAVTFAVIAGNAKLNAQEESSPVQPKSMYELKIEVANVNLKLAETELRLAKQYNREVMQSVPATATEQERNTLKLMQQISESSMERLNSNFEIAREQLAQAVRPSTGSHAKIRKRYAEEKIRLAKVRLDAGLEAKADGLPVKDLEITRLELQYHLAQLKLELLGDPEHLLTLVDSLQRQIDHLSEEFMAHDQRITAIEDR